MDSNFTMTLMQMLHKRFKHTTISAKSSIAVCFIHTPGCPCSKYCWLETDIIFVCANCNGSIFLNAYPPLQVPQWKQFRRIMQIPLPINTVVSFRNVLENILKWATKYDHVPFCQHFCFLYL